jgi:two-component system, chemotaxis family, chemotaxis protein CheY
MSKTILTIDDSASIRQMVAMTLKSAGHTVLEAGNGAEGYDQATAHTVHAVITDLNMPVMNGMQLLREMAKRDSWKDLLRIIISTDGSKLRREEARELNVNLYVEKPFRPEVVRDVLCQIAGA